MYPETLWYQQRVSWNSKPIWNDLFNPRSWRCFWIWDTLCQDISGKESKNNRWSSISSISGFRCTIGWNEVICTGRHGDTHMTYVYVHSLHRIYEDLLVACMCLGADTDIFSNGWGPHDACMDTSVLVIDRKQGAWTSGCTTPSQIGMPGVQGKAVAEAYPGAAGGWWTLSPAHIVWLIFLCWCFFVQL